MNNDNSIFSSWISPIILVASANEVGSLNRKFALTPYPQNLNIE